MNDDSSVMHSKGTILDSMIREDSRALRSCFSGAMEWVKGRWLLIAASPFFAWFLFVWFAVGGDYRVIEGVYRLGDVREFYASALVVVVLGLGIPVAAVALVSLSVLKFYFHHKSKTGASKLTDSRGAYYTFPFALVSVLLFFEPVPLIFRTACIWVFLLISSIILGIWIHQTFKADRAEADRAEADRAEADRAELLWNLEMIWRSLVGVCAFIAIIISCWWSACNMEFLGKQYEFNVEISGKVSDLYVRGTAIKVSSESVVLLEQYQGVVQVLEVPRSRVEIVECKSNTWISKMRYANSGEFVKTCRDYDFDRECYSHGCKKGGKYVNKLPLEKEIEYDKQLKQYSDLARRNF